MPWAITCDIVLEESGFSLKSCRVACQNSPFQQLWMEILPALLWWKVSYESDCLFPVGSENSHWTGCVGTEILFIVHVGLNLPKTLPAGAGPFDFLCNPVWNQILLQTQFVCLASGVPRNSHPNNDSFSALTQIQNTLHILKLFQVIPC